MATKHNRTLYDEKTRIWSGIRKTQIYNPECSVGQVFYMTMVNWPNQVVQISHEDGRKITNAEMRQLATRLALFLKKEKLTHKDVVGIIGGSSTYLTPLAVACFFNTTPFHAVNVTRDAKVVKGLYEITKPKIMFCDGSDYERIKEVTQVWNPKIVTLTGRVKGVLSIDDLLKPIAEERSYQPETLAIDGDQTSAILCSTGTSGLPKAVTMSHNQVKGISSFANSTDIILTHASIDWATGFIFMTVSLMCGIQKVIFGGPFNGANFINMIKNYQASVVFLAPWQTYELFNHPSATEDAFSSVRYVYISGGWISAQVLQRGRNLIRHGMIVLQYGSTETGTVAANIYHAQKSNENKEGRIMPGVRVKIVDDQGISLTHNQIGEVLIDVGTKWMGYVNNSVDTKATLQKGWFNLGDLGYFDNDNNLFIVDRKKDLLRYKSCDYWPNEIEQIIAELPGVLNVCVVGIRDSKYGDVAGALVIKKPGTELTEQEIIDHVANRVVVDYKQLHSGVKFVDALPQNINGKVQRTKARQIFESMIF
ncbi:hypothetical protein ACLKA7_009366 [Drosophila subpalustris]